MPEPLLDPDCAAGKCGSCVGGPCEHWCHAVAEHTPPDDTTPAKANFEGHENRECGEHRTVGPHRAWCHDCSMWCYPHDPCFRCKPSAALPDDTTEDLRERLTSLCRGTLYMSAEGIDTHVENLIAVLAALAGDPGDLPARMAEALRQGMDYDLVHGGAEGIAELFASLDNPLSSAMVTAALSVRWEAAIQAHAEADELRRKLAYAEAELQGRVERAWQAQRERDEARREAERLRAVKRNLSERISTGQEGWNELHRELTKAEADRDALKARLEEAEADQDEALSVATFASEKAQQVRHERDALKAAIARVRAAVAIHPHAEDTSDVQRGYRICSERALAALDAPQSPGDALDGGE